MRLDDGFALGDGVEDFRNTMRDIVPHDIFDKQRRQRDTDHRRDEIPPGAFVGNQLLLYETLDEMDERFQEGGRQRGERADEERENNHQILLADIVFSPLY